MVLAIYVARIVTVWKAGPKGLLLTILLLPEWW
jgi:hypothetical protein